MNALVMDAPPDSPEAAPFADPYADSSARTYASLSHLAGLLALADGMGFVSLLATIVMWRLRADDSPFLDDHGREATNFQISQLLYILVGGVALGLFTLVTLGLGIVLALPIFIIGALALVVVRIVGCIRGAIAANRGEYYRYPMTIRILSGPTD